MPPCLIGKGFLIPEEAELAEKVRKILDDFPEMKYERDGKEVPVSHYMLASAISSVLPEFTLPGPPPEEDTEDFLRALGYVKRVVKRKAETLKLIPAADE